MLFPDHKTNQTATNRRKKPKQGWYFVMFAKDLLDNCPYRFTLYNEPFVLYRERDGKLVCYLLSLHQKAKFANNACIKSFLVVEKQGIIWLWRGQSELADESLITVMNGSGQPVKYDDENREK